MGWLEWFFSWLGAAVAAFWPAGAESWLKSLLVDGVIAGVEPFDDDLFLKVPSLRVISRCGSGTDAIDLKAAQKRGIKVLATRDEVVEPVAQMAVGMMLALARNLPAHHADFLAGEWKKRSGRVKTIPRAFKKPRPLSHHRP